MDLMPLPNQDKGASPVKELEMMFVPAKAPTPAAMRGRNATRFERERVSLRWRWSRAMLLNWEMSWRR